MIVYDLECRTHGHRFEGWFGSSDDFASQQARGLLSCPVCNATDIAKAVMAPNVARKGNQLPAPAAPTAPVAAQTKPAAQTQAPLPPEAVKLLQAIAVAQAEALKTSTWVGDTFAEKARAQHYGETDPTPIHGQATPDEAKALIEEGVEIAPILFPIAPPDQRN